MKRVLYCSILLSFYPLSQGCGASSASGGSAPKAASSPAPTSQAFEDLRALERQESWEEMIVRLRAVAPAQRNDEWQQLTERAHVGLLKALPITNAREASLALKQMEQQLADFPFLKKAPQYLAQRAEVGIKAFKWTYSSYRHTRSDEQWVPEIKTFAEKDSTTPKLAQRLAQEVILGRLVADTAWPLYELAFARDGDAVCSDASLPKVVLGAIDGGYWPDSLKAMTTQRCWTQLKAPVLTSVEKSIDLDFAANACEFFKDQPDAAKSLKDCS